MFKTPSRAAGVREPTGDLEGSSRTRPRTHSQGRGSTPTSAGFRKRAEPLNDPNPIPSAGGTLLTGAGRAGTYHRCSFSFFAQFFFIISPFFCPGRLVIRLCVVVRVLAVKALESEAELAGVALIIISSPSSSSWVSAASRAPQRLVWPPSSSVTSSWVAKPSSSLYSLYPKAQKR